MDINQRLLRSTGCVLLTLLFAAFLVGPLPFPPADAQGTVKAWGDNGNGQLGDGTTTDRLIPVSVRGEGGVGTLGGVVAMVGGENHSIALKADGTVWAWGENSSGQLGDGTTTERLTPVQVKGAEGVGVLNGIIRIASGLSHTLALKADGTVWAWGTNSRGHLGDGTNFTRLTPVQVKGIGGNGVLSDVKAISAGYEHSLAVKTDGTVWAWGSSSFGQIGDGNYGLNHYTPVQVRGVNGIGVLTGVANIAGGSYHTVALMTDGTLRAWGQNSNGALGNGTNGDSSLPVQVQGPGGAGNFTGATGIAAGDTHTLALKGDGTVWAWGSNNYGELGDGTANEKFTPVQVKGAGGIGTLSGVVGIASGAFHSLAVKANGTAWAWGANFTGQIGDGTNNDRATPTQTTGITKAVAIAAGQTHSFIIEQSVLVEANIHVAEVSSYTFPVHFAFRPMGGGNPFLRDATPGGNGYVSFSDIPDGTYDVAVKGANTLQKVVPNVNTTGGVNFGTVTLLPGDATGDNSVNFDDFLVLADAYFTVSGDALYDTQADFNTDGEVNFDDFLLLAENYFTDGDN